MIWAAIQPVFIVKTKTWAGFVPARTGVHICTCNDLNHSVGGGEVMPQIS